MLQRLARSGARRCICRPTLSTRGYYAQPVFASAEVSDGPVASSSDASSSSSDSAVTSAEPPSEGALDGALSEKAKNTRAKRTAKDPNAPKKERRPKEKKEKKPVEPLKPLEESETYLNYLGAVHRESTLPEAVQDAIEKLRPERHPHRFARDFKEKYETLVTRLCDAFSRDQLKQYCEEKQLYYTFWTKEKRKVELAEAIVVQIWEWPSLAELERELRERSEVMEAEFPLDAPVAFLVMGKDGSDLHQMSRRYDVAINLGRGANQFHLRARGVRKSLDAFATHVEETKKAILVENFRLPLDRDIPPQLVQRISRLSGTFLEPMEDQPHTIRLHAKFTRDIEAAKRLATQAVTFDTNTRQATLLSYLPPKVESKTLVPLNILPPSYSLYPFISPRSLPWTMSGSAFRVRRVGEWLGHKASEDVRDTGGLVGGRATISNLQQETADIRSILLDGFTQDVNRPVQIHASLGHLLFTSSSPAKTLIPPLTGSVPLNKVTKWVADENVRPEFVTSLPSVVTDASASDSKRLHRLTYRVVSPEGASEASTGKPYKMIVFEAVVVPSADGDSSSRLMTIRESCVAGVRKDLDLLTPDRPMDIRFTASQLSPIEMPTALASYAEDFSASWTSTNDGAAANADPIPPLKVTFEGEEYYLQQSITARQSQETVNIKPAFSDYDSILSDKIAPIIDLPIIKESMADSESELKTTACQVSCSDHTSSDDWGIFLDRCDQLSTVAYTPSGAGSTFFNETSENKFL